MDLMISDQELRLREFGEKRHNLEENVRLLESYKIEALELRGEIRKLNDLTGELSEYVQILRKDLVKLQVENKQIPDVRSEIKDLQEELNIRAAIEYDRSEKFELMDQRQCGVGGPYGMDLNNANGPHCGPYSLWRKL